MTTDTKDLMEAREAMAAVLDAKFPEMREWKAFRTIDRLLLASLIKTPTPRAAVAR